jgi:hypothetical protein
MNKLLSGLLVASTLLSASAEEQFFQASVSPKIAIHSEDTRINGITLNLWGQNPQSAFAWGFVNGSTGDSLGFSMSFFFNYAENFTGVQWAFANYSTGKFIGWQGSAVNIGNEVVGLQSGTVNWAKNVRGVQFGFFNYTEDLYGVQIGAVNIVKNNPWFKEFPDKLATGMVFVNWAF